MLVISLRFITGRYHATPWGRHVNEGATEWPPSPWRLLRALVAVWRQKGSELADENLMRSLLEALSSTPSYRLPPSTEGHLRHYMPIRGGTTKVFDTFVRMDDSSALLVAWPDAELTPEQTKLLDALLERLSYLGRAEGWVEARRFDGEVDSFNVTPQVPGDEEGESIRLLAPMPPARYVEWRESMLDAKRERRLAELREKALSSGKNPDSVKLSAKDARQIEESLPTCLLSVLEQETRELRKAGWSQPPGTTWVTYQPILTDARSPRKPSRARQKMIRVARFAVAGTVRPRLTESLSLAERIRMAVMAQFKHSAEGVPSVFSGKTPEGAPLSVNSHMFVLPEANDGTGEITHVVLYAPMGFSPEAQAALSRLRKVWGLAGHEVHLALIGVGDERDFGGLRAARGESPILAESRVWVSRTPFVPIRHPKRHRDGKPKLRENGEQIDGLEDQIRLELKRRGLPDPARIERLPETALQGKPLRWSAFRTERHRGGGTRAALAPSGFRLIFDEPVRGPLALGYGAHFGLGCFAPEDSP